MAMSKPEKLHVVMFPWLAFGHMIPFLELSKHIAQKGHKMSFVSTPRNIDRLPKLPPTLSPLINFVKIPLPHSDNIPANAEATSDVPYNKVQYLKTAYDGLQSELTHFLETSSPDWIIYDFAPHWLPPVASKLGISRAFFSIFNACAGAFFGPATIMINGDDYRKKPEDFTVPPKWVTFPTSAAFRLHEMRRFYNSLEENVSGVSDWYRYGSAMIGCDVFLIRSCTEIESDWLNLMHELNQKPVFPLGLMPPLAQDSKDDGAWGTISKWLDKQDAESVVYVALGSEITPSQDELTELSLGLELSGLPFFWALRKHHGTNEFQSFELPNGFEERVKGRGIIWTSWAPQLKILGHDSVGGFVTHCGWSSIIEGLQFGRPLIMLPFLGDQGLNARVFEEKGVGVEIPRDEEDGALNQSSVAESLRLVMVGSEGRKQREKAKEMKAIFGDQRLHKGYIDRFLEYLEQHVECPVKV